METTFFLELVTCMKQVLKWVDTIGNAPNFKLIHVKLLHLYYSLSCYVFTFEFIYFIFSYFSVNVPLKEGMDDIAYETVFQPVIRYVMQFYQPSVKILISS